jgi:hypothetical protein
VALKAATAIPADIRKSRPAKCNSECLRIRIEAGKKNSEPWTIAKILFEGFILLDQARRRRIPITPLKPQYMVETPNHNETFESNTVFSRLNFDIARRDARCMPGRGAARSIMPWQEVVEGVL